MATALAVLYVAAAERNAATINQELKYAKTTFDAVTLYGLETKIGTGLEKKTDDSAFFMINLARSDVLVGDKNTAKWGINCSGAAENSCDIDPAILPDEFRPPYKFRVHPASMHLRVDMEHNLNATASEGKKEVAKLAAKIAFEGNKGPAGDWGELGVSPSSEFGRYFSEVYQTAASLLLLFKAEAPEKVDPAIGMRIFINPYINDTHVVLVKDTPAAATNWHLFVDHASIDPAYNMANAKICLNTFGRELLQVEDPQVLCDAYRKVLCKDKAFADCKKADVKLEEAPKLVLKIEKKDYSFEFESKDFIYFDDGQHIQCRFGDIKKLRKLGACDKDSVAGLSQLFLAKYLPVFKYEVDGKRTLRLMTSFDAPEDPQKPSKSRLWIILAVVAVAVALIVMVAVIMRKKKTSDAEYYRDFDNTTAH